MFFPTNILPDPIVAIPDVHLGDGTTGDLFLKSPRDKVKLFDCDARNPARLFAKEPIGLRPPAGGLVRRLARDRRRRARDGLLRPSKMSRGMAPSSSSIKRSGLLHLIGNHDASFLYALPDRRVGDTKGFRLGYWMGPNVYALHGHQFELAPPANIPSDIFWVALATSLAKVIPTVVSIEEAVDQGDTGLITLLTRLLGINRDDVHHPERAVIHPPPWPVTFTNAPFVDREDRAKLIALTDQLLATKPPERKVDLLLVGHSHAPCISWSTAKSGSPVVVVDGGSFSYDQSNLLIAAGNTVAIFDVV